MRHLILRMQVAAGASRDRMVSAESSLASHALTGLSDEQLEAGYPLTNWRHIQRFDPFVNVFQVCVETLLFYHPAIWWLNKRFEPNVSIAVMTRLSLCVATP